MFGTQNLLVFLVAAISLNLLPGADTLYTVTCSIARGRKAGIVSVFGISSGLFVHTTAAALGLSAILATSAVAFTIVKLAGAVYLVYLGISLFISNKSQDDKNLEIEKNNLWIIYRKGVLTNTLNPKVALFFLAFLPQFVNSSASYKVLSFFFLGFLFIIISTLWLMFIALLASKTSHIIRSKNGLMNIVNKITGVIFVGLGIKLATEQAK